MRQKKHTYWPKHFGTSKHVLFSDPKRKAAFFYRPKGICQEKFQGTQWINIAVDWNDLLCWKRHDDFPGEWFYQLIRHFFWNLCRVGRPSCEKTLSFCWFCSWKMRVIFCLVLGVWNYFFVLRTDFTAMVCFYLNYIVLLFTMHPCSCSLTMWSSCCYQNLTIKVLRGWRNTPPTNKYWPKHLLQRRLKLNAPSTTLRWDPWLCGFC